MTCRRSAAGANASRIARAVTVSLWVASGMCVSLLPACGWNPSRPFDRDAPPVKQAIADLDAGNAASAAARLEQYLSTGPCNEGNLGTPDVLRQRPDGTFDLGLSLFRIGELYGRRFGEEEVEAGTSEATRANRHAQVGCAQRLVDAIAGDPHAPLALRVRGLYLAGNLSFLDGAYEGAVSFYDRALVLAPGQADAGDPVGRDAAWNRSIALKRIEDEKDAGRDSGSDASSDAAGDASKEDGDSGKRPPPDAGHDSGKDDSAHDSGGDSGPPEPPPDAGDEHRDAGAQPPPPSSDQDERMLDQLERAPTLQQEEAKRSGQKRVRGMADK